MNDYPTIYSARNTAESEADICDIIDQPGLPHF